MLTDISAAFADIPIEQILRIAREVQSALKSDHSLIRRKSAHEYVTSADIEIQSCILAHFAASKIAGKYEIKAEETISESQQPRNIPNAQFQLLVDPLDGTNAFCRGENLWGCMIGLCDRSGRLIYSWNLLPDGTIYSSNSIDAAPSPQTWKERLQTQGTLQFDVYDYEADRRADFPKQFISATGNLITADRLRLTSYPSAVTAGWQLYNNRLDGLLWLPSRQGKGCYPDYDLSFLGAVASRGWQVALGKQRDIVRMVAVAADERELETLWKIGSAITESTLDDALSYNRDLQITSALSAQSI